MPGSNDPKAHLYAGKGIFVCERWMKFENFLADMGEAPTWASIERVDGNMGYGPENCVWATSKQQANNTAANHIVEVNGARKTVSQWSDESGIKPNTIIWRLRRGWSDARAVSELPR